MSTTGTAADEADADLLRRARDYRDTEAWIRFEKIYRQYINNYSRWLVGRFAPYRADEVAEIAMYRVVLMMPHFEYGRVRNGRNRNFRGLLKKIVRSVVWALRPLPQPLPDGYDQVVDRRTPELAVDAEDLLEFCLAKVVRRLRNPNQLVLWRLRELEGRSVSELVDQLGIHRRRIDTAVHRVNRYLEEELIRSGHADVRVGALIEQVAAGHRKDQLPEAA